MQEPRGHRPKGKWISPRFSDAVFMHWSMSEVSNFSPEDLINFLKLRGARLSYYYYQITVGSVETRAVLPEKNGYFHNKRLPSFLLSPVMPIDNFR